MNIPKVDLHLHLDGSLSKDVILKILEEEPINIDIRNIEKQLTVPQNCTSLVDYLTCFELPLKVLQSERSLSLSAYDLVERLAKDGLVYAEIRFAPQLHTAKGLTQEQVIEAVLRGVNKAMQDYKTIKVGVILCAMVTVGDRDNKKDNMETIELSKGFIKKGVVGVDLAGAEGAVPMENFGALFQKAYQESIPFTIHAGECGNYYNIAKAVSFGAKRIGHGCSAMYSKDIRRLLRDEKIALEVCVTSNLQTKAIHDVREHPIRQFYEDGIIVTVNTDNMTVSNTNLEKEYRLLEKELLFNKKDILVMSENSLKVAFSNNLL